MNGYRAIAFLATNDAEASKAFFADVVGLRLVSDEPFALVFDAGGTQLRIAKVEQLDPAPHTVFGLEVDDVAATVDGLAARGVSFERFPGMECDERGVWQSAGGAQVAWFKDPCGNVLSLTQPPG